MIPVATLHRIATIDERYQSYNVEMAEVIGGNFWKPYGRGIGSVMYAGGRLLYLRGTVLTAQALDPGTGHLTGDAEVIASEVGYDLSTWRGLFTASDRLLIYSSGGLGDGKLQWFSATGEPKNTVTDSMFEGLALSPDGSKLLEITNPGGDLLLAIVNGSTRTKLVPQGNNTAPVWSPDGRRVAFNHIGSPGLGQVVLQSADGSGAFAVVHGESIWQNPTDWSPDGKYILYERGEPGTANGGRCRRTGQASRFRSRNPRCGCAMGISRRTASGSRLRRAAMPATKST
jgi:hypothetical protein